MPTASAAARPTPGTSAAAVASTARTPARPGAVIYSPQRKALESSPHDLFDVEPVGRIDNELSVNAGCAKVAQALHQERFQYLAGECNAQALPDGLAAVQVRGTDRRAPLVLQGIFSNGALVRGMLYRVSQRRIDTGLSGNMSTLLSAFECSDVNVIEKEGVNLHVLERLQITSTPSTVCRHGGSSNGTQTYGYRYFRVLRPTVAQAVGVASGRGPQVASQTPASARLIFSDRLEEMEGSFERGDERSVLSWRDNFRGQMRVAFAGSRVWYLVEGTSLCVEGTRTCGPMFRLQPLKSNNVTGWVSAAAFVREGDFRVVAPRMQFNDGTVFEPERGDRPYDVFYGVAAPQGSGWRPVGDAVWVRPVEGRITDPDGRQYSGRFVDGKPLAP